MFCADYIGAFIFHAGINFGLWKTTTTRSASSSQFKILNYVHGAGSGVMSALIIYPFDFVRQGAITSSKASIKHNLAVVPYATVFFGIYFSNRDAKSLPSQMRWALMSASMAVLAELPFDKAKRDMFGSAKATLLANSLFVPFGALLLVMYDKALMKNFK